MIKSTKLTKNFTKLQLNDKIKNMKKVVIIILISLTFIIGCGKIEEKENQKYQTITSEEAWNMMQTRTDLIILDVRSEAEYKESHIANSVNIPVNEIGDRFKEEITDDITKTILIYCRSGVRAKQASELLTELGYQNIINFGGITNWEHELITE